MVLVTGVDHVALDFGTASERPIDAMTADEAEHHLLAGQFPPGSMGPKIAAALHYVESGGERAVITSLDRLHDALCGDAGTRIVP
jgi:carbamate kinase